MQTADDGRTGPNGVRELVGRQMGEIFTHNQALRRTVEVNGIWHQMTSPVAQHARGVACKPQRNSNILVVFLDSTVWMYEAKMRTYELMAEWNHLCQESGKVQYQVSGVVCKLSTLARDAGATNTVTTAADGGLERRPLSDREKEYVDQTLAPIADADMERHVRDAMVSIMEWKKSKK